MSNSPNFPDPKSADTSSAFPPPNSDLDCTGSSSTTIDTAAQAPTHKPIPGNKFIIRLPQGLRKQISLISRENHRSMNSEIIKVLEEFLLKNSNGESGHYESTVSKEASKMRELNQKLRQLSMEKKEALLALLD